MIPLALLALASLQRPAPSDGELVRRAEEAFAEGVRRRASADEARPHFARAAEALEELRRRGAHNPMLYRSLGNAHLLAGDLPRAIVSYRRGLRLAPGDAGLRADLEAARGEVGYGGNTLGRPPRDDRPPWLPHASPGWFFWPAAALYAASWFFLARWRMRRRAALLTGGIGLLVGAAALAVPAFLLHRADARERAEALVVIREDGVLLRRGDDLAFPPRYETPVNRGVEGRLLYGREGWLQIELADGAVGWVPAEYALVE